MVGKITECKHGCGRTPDNRNKECQVSRHMKRRGYGITCKERDDMFQEQYCKCAICGNEIQFSQSGPMSTRANLDHCHKTGKIRGILCTNCNIGLGKFFDNKDLLQSAIIYLED